MNYQDYLKAVSLIEHLGEPVDAHREDVGPIEGYLSEVTFPTYSFGEKRGQAADPLAYVKTEDGHTYECDPEFVQVTHI